MEQITELTLSTGFIVRCRPVPPYAAQDVWAALPRLPVPQVTLEGIAGAETLRALPGSEEYEAYREAMDARRQDLSQQISNFNLDYGVVEWQPPDKVGTDTWYITPPTDWKLPGVLIRWGLKQPEGFRERRISYLKCVVVGSDDDQSNMDAVIMQIRPVTKEEVLAALDPSSSVEGTESP